MAPPTWIFFDLFDTLCLVDEPAYVEGKRAAAERAGVEYDLFMEAWRATAEEASLGRLASPFARVEEAFRKIGLFDRAAAAEVARLDVETLQRAAALYEGAPEALATLRERGFKLGLISNATPTTAFLVAPLRLRSLLDLLLFSYEVGSMKPDPAIYRRAISRSGCEAGRSLFVGDGANRELDAARDVGMATLLLDHPEKAWSFRDPERLSLGDHPSVESFAQLLSLPDLQSAGEAG